MYRTIDACFWTDPKVRSLEPSGKLFLAYLITNPHSHVSGIYILPRLYAHHETGLSEAKLDTLSDTLSGLGIAKFDSKNSVVFVVNMLGYQGRGEKNLRSAANQLSSLHKSFLIRDFADKYPNVKRYISQAVADTLSDTLSGSGTPEQEQDIKKTIPKELPLFPQDRKTPAPDAFEITEGLRAWATENKVTVDLDRETEAMLDHHRKVGSRFVDWNAAWRTWMRNSIAFEAKKGNGNGHVQQHEGPGQNSRAGTFGGGEFTKPYIPRQR